jgi:hypothetical protein
MGTVLPAWVCLVGQAQVSLIDQCRGLQYVAGTFCAHLAMGQATEFLVDERR